MRRQLLLPAVIAALTLTGPAALAAAPTGRSSDQAAALRAPTVRSYQYPDGVPSPPRPGVLRFGANGVRDVVQFQYSYYSDAPVSFVPAVDGVARVPFTPTASGPLSLFVHSINAAGTVSAVRTYRIYVASHGKDLAVSWPLDDPAGSRQAVDTVSGRVAALEGDAHFQADSGRLAQQDPTTQDGSLALDTVGDGARADGPVIDTSAPFTAMAWVRLTDLSEQSGPTRDRPVLSVDGTVRQGLWLGYHADALADDDPGSRDGTFVFRMSAADTAQARVLQVQADRDTVTDALTASAINSNGYINITGVYYGAGRLGLFINGMPAGTTTGSRRDWAASGPLRLGSTRAADAAPSTNGSLDRVKAYSSALFDVEVLLATFQA